MIDENRLEQMMVDVMRKMQKPPKPHKMEFSKKLVLAFFIFCGILSVVFVVMWYLTGEWPQEIFEAVLYPLAVAIFGYLCKSAYENKPKIEKWGGDKP